MKVTIESPVGPNLKRNTAYGFSGFITWDILNKAEEPPKKVMVTMAGKSTTGTLGDGNSPLPWSTNAFLNKTLTTPSQPVLCVVSVTVWDALGDIAAECEKSYNIV